MNIDQEMESYVRGNRVCEYETKRRPSID